MKLSMFVASPAFPKLSESLFPLFSLEIRFFSKWVFSFLTLPGYKGQQHGNG